MKLLHLLSGGAAQGLVTQLEDRFEAKSGCGIDASFGAVGMMKDSLLAGAPCDVLILTEALIGQLTVSGELVAGSAQALGVVKTGVAVRAGEPAPDVGSPAALKAALQSARGIYFPDPLKATAGIHFMRVLKQLGLDTELAGRLRPFPNGATAMRALAEAAEKEPGLLGCTQITEILNTPGVQLIAPLPKEFELATVYTAALCTRATQPQAARELIALLASADAAALRRVCGFD
ncbi:substrate-binding domain-containing protein [Polaromonas sp.]|uniref:molybdate ABC transporter substrate-binding protein n=1 Tax=Polaromonas sp. TaxID=1869339 RepID=UPI0017DB68E4|nr:substrate-binding domain-containing protein [Polaromonas sp.]NMM05581.1 ABC transporter substrate-binding protein [Polaromonas sp.]